VFYSVKSHLSRKILGKSEIVLKFSVFGLEKQVYSLKIANAISMVFAAAR